MKNNNFECPVCRSKCSLFDVVDLNKSCEEQRGTYLPLAGVPVYFARCKNCDFCWAPEMYEWSLSEFEDKIYNNEYIKVDPDYLERRPKKNAFNLMSMFPNIPSGLKHLDYGGGNGLLAKTLQNKGWNSVSYDPFVDKNVVLEDIGDFELITAFEVFEHVPDVHVLLSSLRSALSGNGLILFSTLLSDGNIDSNQRLSWWYASPRNGHISLYSRKSLAILAHIYGFSFGSFSSGFHVFFKEVPSWASHFIRKA